MNKIAKIQITNINSLLLSFILLNLICSIKNSIQKHEKEIFSHERKVKFFNLYNALSNANGEKMKKINI